MVGNVEGLRRLVHVGSGACLEPAVKFSQGADGGVFWLMGVL